MGDALFEIAKGEGLPHEVEVELLVWANFAHTSCFNVKGTDRIIAHVHDRLPVYTEQNEFSLVVRLITGLRRYNELQYVFDIIYKYPLPCSQSA